MAHSHQWALILALLLVRLSCSGIDGREYIELSSDGGRGRGSGVVWFVQLSDLHISYFYPNRSVALKKLVPPLLTLINPSLVLITGDLTDGKSKNLAVMRQDESEWIQYKEALDSVIAYSGVPEHAFFDMRGNHDKFGVPQVGGELDYFSKYSISSRLNRTTSVLSVTLLDGEWKHLIVGMDNSMEVGLRGPCNLFGHVSNKRFEVLDAELSQWDDSPSSKVTKLVYGHFPTSFTSSTENGRRIEDIFAKHNISAYLCGHLHYQFGRNLIKHLLRGVSDNVGEFWEWEVGDWKENRVMRVVAIDQGHTSFVDLDLSLFGKDDNQVKGFVLVTYPLDSRKMQRKFSPSLNQHNEIHSLKALVFSEQHVMSVRAKVYDCHTDLLKPVEELLMQHLWKDGNTVEYFVTSLNMSKYLDPSPVRYLLQVVAYDAIGREIVSDLRPFSANGHIKPVEWTWKEFFVFGIVWDTLYKPLLWASFFVLASFLILQKLCLYMMMKGELSASRDHQTNWMTLTEALIKACEMSNTVWWGQLILLLYLMYMPWFWGMVFGEDFPSGSISTEGWSIKLPTPKRGLGVPDVMVIVLPYLYEVLIPVFVLVFSLFFEQSIVEVNVRLQNKRHPKEQKNGTEMTQYKNPMVLETQYKICNRWLRKVLLSVCLGITFLHAKHTEAIVGAYGWKVILISPGFAWPAPVLLVTAVLQTSSIKNL